MQRIKGPLMSVARTAGVCTAAVLMLGACGSVASTPVVPVSSVASPTYDPNEFDLTPVLPLATKWPEPPTPAPQPTRDPNAGFSLGINADFAAPPTVEEYASWFGMYVVGTITEVLPAQWSTPDGRRPPGIMQTDLGNTYFIITPVVVKLDEPPLLNRYGIDTSSGTIVLAAFGGKVGKDSIEINDPSQHLYMGDHLLIGVTNGPYMGTTVHVPYWTPAGSAWSFGMTYHLESDGLALASMPNATPVATQDLVQAIKDAAAANP